MKDILELKFVVQIPGKLDNIECNIYSIDFNEFFENVKKNFKSWILFVFLFLITYSNSIERLKFCSVKLIKLVNLQVSLISIPNAGKTNLIFQIENKRFLGEFFYYWLEMTKNMYLTLFIGYFHLKSTSPETKLKPN